MAETLVPRDMIGRFQIVPNCVAINQANQGVTVAVLLDTASGASWFLKDRAGWQKDWDRMLVLQTGDLPDEDSK